MRSWLRAVLGSCAIFSLVAACGLDDSVIDGFETLPDASDDGTLIDSPIDSAPADSGSDSDLPDATIFDATVHDSGPDSEVDAQSDAAPDASDAGADASDAGPDTGCAVTVTICDGNPAACGGGQVCVPDIPAGWTYMGFDDSTHTPTVSPCGTDFTGASLLQVADAGAAVTCACQCDAGTTPSCDTDEVALFTGATCNGSDAVFADASASCTPSAAPFNIDTSGLSGEVLAQPSSCAANVTTTNRVDWDQGGARECNFTGDGGAFCASHSTCVEASGAAHNTCVKQAYSGAISPACGTACPTGFQNTCYVATNTVNDGRACTGCTCLWSGAGCDSPSITGFDTTDCSGSSTAVGASCGTTALTEIDGVTVTGTASAASPTCDVNTPVAASGGVTFGSTEDIVCCAN